MINQLWQGKQVSLDSTSFLHSTSACLPQSSEAGGGFLGCPCVSTIPLKAGDGGCEKAMSLLHHQPDSGLQGCSSAASGFLPAQRCHPFLVKRKKMSLVSGRGEVAVTILAYQAFVTQIQEIMCLDIKIKAVQFPFIYLLHFEVSWS